MLFRGNDEVLPVHYCLSLRRLFGVPAVICERHPISSPLNGRDPQIALGSIRAICYYHADPAAVYLPMAYAKADREDMKPADKKAWSRLVAEIKKEEAK